MKEIPKLNLKLPLPPLIYLGCGRVGEKGHYFFVPGMIALHTAYPDADRLNYHELAKMDGGFAPQDTVAQGQAWYHCWHLIDNVWCNVISFWDRSVDDRGSSNSTFLVLDVPLCFADALTKCQEGFPEVFARFQFKVDLIRNMFA